MNKKQWNVLGYMFVVFCFVASIARLVASTNEFLSYLYWFGIWAVAAITCFICGRLEEVDAK